jgi:hypothetical protein
MTREPRTEYQAHAVMADAPYYAPGSAYPRPIGQHTPASLHLADALLGSLADVQLIDLEDTR